MQRLLLLANEKSYSVYFFGAKEEVLIDMLEIFKKDYPNLRVLGHRNGYFSEEDEYGIQEDIRAKNPDFVFVGITSPKKEYIIQKFMDQGVNSVFMGVEVALTFYLVILNELLYGCNMRILSGCSEWQMNLDVSLNVIL